jgi:hypothetical protein
MDALAARGIEPAEAGARSLPARVGKSTRCRFTSSAPNDPHGKGDEDKECVDSSEIFMKTALTFNIRQLVPVIKVEIMKAINAQRCFLINLFTLERC